MPEELSEETHSVNVSLHKSSNSRQSCRICTRQLHLLWTITKPTPWACIFCNGTLCLQGDNLNPESRQFDKGKDVESFFLLFCFPLKLRSISSSAECTLNWKGHCTPFARCVCFKQTAGITAVVPYCSSSGAYFQKVFEDVLCVTAADQSFVGNRNKLQSVCSKAVLRPRVNDLCDGNRILEVMNYQQLFFRRVNYLYVLSQLLLNKVSSFALSGKVPASHFASSREMVLKWYCLFHHTPRN